MTRADTVIFVELDWVPAALLQAEDRIHRVGQKASCLVLHLIAKFDDNSNGQTLQNLDELLIEIIGSKMDRIGFVLDEDSTNLITNDAKSAVATQLLRSMRDKAQGSSDAAPILPSQEPFAICNPLVTSQSVDVPKIATAPKFPKRGRPRVYIDREPLNAAERTKQSITALKKRGGKRLMLRLSPEGLEALKKIMIIVGIDQETEAINRILIAHTQTLPTPSSDSPI